MKILNKILCLTLCCFCAVLFCSCKAKEEQGSKQTKTEAIGFIVYQKSSESEHFNKLLATPTKITEYFEIKDNTATAKSNHLFYLFSTDAFETGTKTIKTNTTTKDIISANKTLSLKFELALETSEAIVFIIYKHPDGTYTYEFDKTIKNISTNPIESTINLEDNSHITKMNITFAKNISEQEEYQR